MADPDTGDRRSFATVRGGFTLLELLIVIGILATLMGLTVGGWLALTGGNAMVGAEHLVVDLIRQARHTARTSGAPVVLVFDPVQNQVRGVSRTQLFQEGFDDQTWDTKMLSRDGQTGYALAPDVGWTDAMWGDPKLVQPIDPVKRFNVLERPNRNDGWILSATVRPPRATATNSVEVLPIIAVAKSGSLRLEDSQAGLLLARYSYIVQSGGVSPDIRSAVWQIVGWRMDADGKRTLLSSQVAVSADQISASSAAAVDLAGPMTGERWYDLALVWDGTALSLRRGGLMVAAQHPEDETGSPRPADFDPQVVLGQLNIGEGTNPLAKATGMRIDDVAIWRLGSDQPTAMPRGVTISGTTAIRVVADPNGSITAATINLTSEKGNRANIEIDNTGKLTSTVSYLNQ